MIPHSARINCIHWVDEAVKNKARRGKACDVIGISIRTLQNWQKEGEVQADKRLTAVHPSPSHKLTAIEREEILTVCNEPPYANLPPSQIVPMLADQGRYIASESTFYRVLHEAAQIKHRGRAKERKQVAKPTSYSANAANQIWTWDISYMPTKVIGQFYYLYMIEDIYSRKIVGTDVYEKETGEDAAKLLERTVLNEKCSQEHLVLHSDNGAPMKSQTLRSKMYELNLTSSYSRPRVSNDNPYSEALFRTVKYSPQWPTKGFESLEEARAWVRDFTQWYNHEHQHSRIRFITPTQRHQGEDEEVLNARHQLYLKMQQKNPRRWSKSTRNWKPIGSVLLNPDRVENKG